MVYCLRSEHDGFRLTLCERECECDVHGAVHETTGRAELAQESAYASTVVVPCEMETPLIRTAEEMNAEKCYMTSKGLYCAFWQAGLLVCRMAYTTSGMPIGIHSSLGGLLGRELENEGRVILDCLGDCFLSCPTLQS